MFTMSAREFNQAIAKAQRIADEEPVLVTRRGEPAYVLLSVGEYERLRPGAAAADRRSFLDMIEPLPEGADPDDLFGQILNELAEERRLDLGREIER